MKNVVVIGGGTGTYTVLRGLKRFEDLALTAVVSMADDGGSTGKLRDEYGVLPPGDVRRCIIALSKDREMMRKLFEHRFENGTLGGHSFGNLLITALKDITGDDASAIAEASKLLNIQGRVLPVTLDNVRLVAELEDGQLIVGETNLDIPKHDGNLRIKRVLLSPKATVNPAVTKAIAEADVIVIGPGDLYTSVIANFLATGLPEALAASKAKKVYVCNLMTKHGETNGFAVTDFVREVENYIGRNALDYVLYTDESFSPSLLATYAEEQAFPVHADTDRFSDFNAKFVNAPMVTAPVLIRHDCEKLAEVIRSV